MTSAKPLKKTSPRLPGFDYTISGPYFITICTRNRQSLFGHIKGGVMHLNENGQAVQQAWDDLPKYYRCELGIFVVMPNHVHGIITINTPIVSTTVDRAPIALVVPAGLRPAGTTRAGTATPGKNYSLSQIIASLKSFSSRRINELRNTLGQAVWHRSFYDHIISDEESWERIDAYIRRNPQAWQHDRHNPITKTRSASL